MIWFACKQCGKPHCRPENSAGTLVFCECGQGNTIPWESTLAEDAVPRTAPPPMPEAKVVPVPSLAPAVPPRPEPKVVIVPPTPLEPAPMAVVLSPVAPVVPTRIPNACFNHEGVPFQAECGDCTEKFCRDCLVYVQGKPLCGPCKNHRVRAMHRPLPRPAWAVWSAVLALCTGPLVFCLYPFGTWAGLLSLLPQLFAFGLGLAALSQVLKDAKKTGLSLALTGVVASGLGLFWTAFVCLFASRLWA